MTPNPESPIFKQNYISEYACENAKKLGEVYTQIKNDAKHGRWNGITDNDITLEYNTYDGRTRVEAKLIDNNTHTHHFIIQLLPNNGFGDGMVQIIYV